MANICDTDLRFEKTENTTKFNLPTIVKELEKSYGYGEGDLEEVEEDRIEGWWSTRWNCQEKDLAEVCKKFKIRARAIGREDGIGFIQCVLIEDTGEIIRNEELDISFDD